MSKSKREREREWKVRKEEQPSHGKVESFKELKNKKMD